MNWLLSRFVDGPSCHVDAQGDHELRWVPDVSRGLVLPVVLSFFGLGVALIFIEVGGSVPMCRSGRTVFANSGFYSEVASLADVARITTPPASQRPTIMLKMDLGIMEFGVE